MRVDRILITGVVLALAAGACGGGEDLEVSDVWARSSARMQNAGAVYMEITGAESADALESVSVASSVAGMAQLHESSMDAEGVMSMEEVASIAIPADATVVLEPGGYHIMLMNLTEPLVVGMEFDVTLTFADAGNLTVTAEVREN